MATLADLQGLMAKSDARWVGKYPGPTSINASLTSRPASHWRLGEAAGPFADSMGAVAGTLVGGATRNVAGALSPQDTNGALELDGTTGYVDFGDVYAFTGVAPFSVGGWFWFDSPATNRRFVSRETATDGWFLRNNSGQFVFSRVGAGVVDQIVAGVIPSDAWCHIIGTYDGATLTGYVNGVVVGTVASTRSIGASANVLRLGYTPVGGNFMDGRADELGIWARALTTAEVVAQYASRNTPPPSRKQALNHGRARNALRETTAGLNALQASAGYITFRDNANQRWMRVP